METTRIVLVRHGESLAQERQIVGGHRGCVGLSERGRRQAEALHDRLSSTGELADAAGLYASIMPRAVETAAVIADVVGGHQPVSDCNFCEFHPGAADGLPWAEAQRLYPPAPDREPGRRWAPGAETWLEMSERVARALDTVVARHRGGTVVVVCHGGVIAHSMIRWLRLPSSPRAGDRAFVDPANTSLTEWRMVVEDPDTPGRPELVRFNDFAHLSHL
jgi:probable phosphoglycerate mutase